MVQGKGMRILANSVLTLLAAFAILPIVLLLIGSFTDNTTALQEGFSYFPSKLSGEAYRYILDQWTTIGKGYLNTILISATGTAVSLLITAMFSYGLAIRDLPGRGIIMGILLLTMLFNGGIVSQFFVYTNFIRVKDTFFALLVPNFLLNGFNVILVSNYFRNNVFGGILEAAKIDGASEYRIFWKIAVPLSVPILATIGVMTAIGYWNDWTNGLYYLSARDGKQYYTIQLILNEINNNVNFLASRAAEMGLTLDTSSIPSTTVRMAIAFVGILPVLVAYPFFQKYFVKGISVGGLKG